MRVFVTGATGFLGSAVVADLLGAGHEAVGLVRSPERGRSLESIGATALVGDLNDAEMLAREAGRADAVIHTAFDHDFTRMAESCHLDRRAIEAMGIALRGSGKPFIVTSGLPVIPGRVASEDDLPPPGGMPRVSEQTAMSMVDQGFARRSSACRKCTMRPGRGSPPTSSPMRGRREYPPMSAKA